MLAGALSKGAARAGFLHKRATIVECVARPLPVGVAAPLTRTQSGIAALRRTPSNLGDARALLAEAGIAAAEQDLEGLPGMPGYPAVDDLLLEKPSLAVVQATGAGPCRGPTWQTGLSFFCNYNLSIIIF